MGDVFAITPAGPRAWWFLAGVCVFLLGIGLLLVWVAYSSRHSRVEVGSESIRLVGDLWGRSIPLDALDLSRARALDLAETPEYRPRSRRWGTGLPGYASGWFRLENGEKALVYLTDWREVAYVPTADGYSLLLSVAPPQALLDALARRRRP